jgi:hypothetical protein
VKSPELNDFELSAESIKVFNSKIEKFSKLFNHTIPLCIGAVLGLILYVFLYKPFTNPDLFQIFISFFIFGGFGLLFLGIPLMFFKILYKFFSKYIVKKNKTYNNIQNYYSAKQDFDVWNMRNSPDFWKSLDSNSLKNEMVKLFKKEKYYILSESLLSYKNYDIVLNKEFKTIPVLCISQKKALGLKSIRSFLNSFNGLTVSEKIIVSMSGFTNQSKKFSAGNNIILMGVDEVMALNKKLS